MSEGPKKGTWKVSFAGPQFRVTRDERKSLFCGNAVNGCNPEGGAFLAEWPESMPRDGMHDVVLSCRGLRAATELEREVARSHGIEIGPNICNMAVTLGES